MLDSSAANPAMCLKSENYFPIMNPNMCVLFGLKTPNIKKHNA